MSIKKEKTRQSKTDRKIYRQPELISYGSLKDLTTGGSGTLGEPNPEKGGQPKERHP